ncbi:MAG: hypothetical protein KDB53_11565, partial [Planctomycetes bacterium]|nr:hypothetical protein [Planctomycetota bacterium]
MKTTILAFVLSATLAVASTSGPIGGPIGSPIQGPCGHGHGEAAPHVINIQSFGGNTGAISWSGGTATFIYNDAVTMPSSISNLESGSDPLLACSVGAQVWEDASTFNYVDGGTSTVTDVGTDSINLITFQNTMANTMAVGGALAVTLTSFNSALDIVEADIIFNPATNFSTLGS